MADPLKLEAEAAELQKEATAIRLKIATMMKEARDLEATAVEKRTEAEKIRRAARPKAKPPKPPPEAPDEEDQAT